MTTNRGWSAEDENNKGQDARKAETDRLNAKSNAQQQAASNPPSDAPDGEAPAPGPDAPPAT